MEEIAELVDEISKKLQLLEKKLQDYDTEKVEIRFPRGFLRRAVYFRGRLSFIQDETLKRNLAYHFLLSDVYRWILNRFDIALTAQEMIIKEGLSLFGNIIAAIVVDIANRIKTPQNKRGVSASITILVKNNIISKEICAGPHVKNTSELGRFKIKIKKTI